MGVPAENGAPIKVEAKEAKVTPIHAQLAPGAVAEHPPADPEAFYSPDHRKEREERQARRDFLKIHRNPIETVPLNHCWEIPGR